MFCPSDCVKSPSTTNNSSAKLRPPPSRTQYRPHGGYIVSRLSFPAAPTLSALARTRWATRLQFMALGVIVGTWGAHIPSLKARYALSEATLSLVLLAVAIGTVLALLIAGRIVGRLGARKTSALSALSMSLMLGVALEFPSVAVLLPAMVIFGASMSLFDVAINTEGSELESLSGRAIMSNLHGMFSVGGMAGAALAAVAVDTWRGAAAAALRRLRRHRDRRPRCVARHARDARRQRRGRPKRRTSPGPGASC